MPKETEAKYPDIINRKKRRICGNCYFYESAECRRNPPTAIHQGMAVFPIVHFESWCGEIRVRN